MRISTRDLKRNYTYNLIIKNVFCKQQFDLSYYTVPIEQWQITSEYVTGTNVLGLVFHSLLIGMAIGNIGANGKLLAEFFTCLSNVMMMIMKWITWCAATLFFNKTLTIFLYFLHFLVCDLFFIH